MSDAASLPIGSVVANGFQVAVALRSPGADNLGLPSDAGFRWSGNWTARAHDSEVQELLDNGADVLRTGPNPEPRTHDGVRLDHAIHPRRPA